MPKATAGEQYIVSLGDTLSGIAKQAYGDGAKWKLIWRANQSVLKSGDPNLIFPGETINIPPDPLANQVSQEIGTNDDDIVIPDQEKDEMTVLINGKKLLIQSGRVIRTMDTAADAWTAVIAWDPDDDELYDLLKPYAYNKATVYLGGVQVIDGILYNQKIKLAPDGRTMELFGWSYTADIIDSAIRPPYEQNKITLEDRAIELIEPLGIGIVFDAEDADEQFSRVTCGAEDKIFDHLAELAVQRKVLISSTRRGEALFWRAATGTKPVGTIEEDSPPYETMEVNFDGRARFNVYTVIGQSPQKRGRRGKNKKLTAVAKDNVVPRSRFTAMTVNESTIGNIQDAADWKRSKQIAESLTMPFPVDSWYAPSEDNKLWQENTLITVISPACFVKDGFDFLIRSIEYEYRPEGTTATLNLIPPQAYTGDPIDEPWR